MYYILYTTIYKHMFQQSIKLFKTYLKWKPCYIIYNVSLGRTMCDNGRKNHIVWIDMEMTGLNVETSHILEISCVITNSNLKIISNPLNIVINQPSCVLNNMNSWCKVQHAKSKLIEDVRNSKVSLKDAEQIVLKYLENHVPKQTCPMAGNSIYMDRMFLLKYMPLVHNYLHFRIIDVSTIKELVSRWNPQIYNSAPPKTVDHRALSDIKESIRELDYYRKYAFLPQNS